MAGRLSGPGAHDEGGAGRLPVEAGQADAAGGVVVDAVCLSTSVYDHAAGRVGLACLDGEATCSSLVVRTRS